MQKLLAMVLLLLMSASPATLALNPDERLDNPVLEERARKLSAGLRCLVCQNQTIDESEAPLARDLRILVRERLEAGDSDEEVLAFVVARYGEFVLLTPRFTPQTWLLWITPFAVLMIGGALLLWRRAQMPSHRPAEAPLSEAERRALDRLLKRDG